MVANWSLPIYKVICKAPISGDDFNRLISFFPVGKL